MTTGKLILSILLGAIAYWLLDSVTDAFIFQEGTFMSLAFSPVPHEIFMRSIIIALLAATGYVMFMAGKKKETEEELREKGKLLSESQRIAHIGSWSWKVANGRLSWTDETYRIYGQSPETFALSSEAFINLLHPEDRSAMQEWIRSCLAGEALADLEFRVILPDGVVRVLNGRGGLERDVESKPVRMVGTVQDITERKQAVVEVLRQKSLLSTIIESASEAIFAKDIAGMYHIINDAGARMLGYRAADVIGHMDRDLLPAATAAEFRKTDEQVMSSGQAYEREEIGVIGGVTRIFLAHKTPWRDTAGNIVGVIGISNDITARKGMETALRESESRYRDLVENSDDLVCTHDLAGNILSVNDAVPRSLGYPLEAIVGKNLRVLLDPRYHDRFDGYLEQIQADGQAQGIMRIATAHGDIRLWEYRNTLRTEGVAQPVVRGMAHDVTARLLAEKALKETTTRLESVMDSINSLIYVADMKTHELLFMNKYGRDIWGEIAGKTCWKTLQDGQSGPCAFCTNDRLVGQDGTPGDVYAWEFQNTVNSRWYDCRDQAIRWDDGRLVRLEIATDITERKKLEDQLRQAQKMDAIGQLAGGVAHDFNNILSAIMGYGNLAEMKLPEDHPARFDLEQIFQSAARAAALTQSLLTFSRKQPVKMELLALNSVIGKFEKFLLRLLREDIELKTRYSGEALTVTADRGQIEQVVMNLVTNARDAMPGKGALTIETSGAVIDESFVTAHGYGSPGEYALITVTDTGCGMDEETKRKIFEPFFTTKEQGKGTGLGLATVYGIVKTHNGFINVYSEQGRGTAFHIYIPRVRSGATAAEPVKPPAIPLQGGIETILLAEDDASLRKMTSTVLRHVGYTVIEAENGQEAVQKFIENKDSIRLAILDGIMPRMNGKEAYHEIMALAPQVRCIFMSGYAEDVFTKDGILQTDVEFIAKPVTPSVLLAKVREVLDR